MRKWLQISLFAALSLFLADSSFAQGQLYSNIAWRYTPAGAFPASGAAITICTSSATGSPCTPTVTVYQDSALSMPIVLVNGGLPVCSTSPQVGCLDGLGNFSFYVTPGSYTYSVSGSGLNPYGPIPFGVSCVAGVTCITSSGNNTLTGRLNTTYLNAEIYPSGLAGPTCGDKITAAIALLPAGGGVLNINNACGLGSAANPWTAVTLPANVLLRFIEPGVYWISGISSSAGYGAVSSIFPMPQFSNVNPTVQLKMGNGVNAAGLINITGDYFSIYDIALDGNKANNSSAGPNILVSNGKRPHIEGVVTGNSNSHGIRIFSTGTSNVSNGAEIKDVLTYQNGGDGVSCQGSNDAELTLVNMENNTGNGASFHDCRTPRLVHDDFGANTQGLNVDCTFAGNGGIGGILVGSELGNQFQNDIVITGYSGGTCATSWTITGNDFAGSGNRPANTYSDIVLVDGGNNTIVGNTIQASAAATSDKYAFNITETAVGRANPNTISGNMLTVIPANPWGTAPYFDSTSNGSIGQVVPTKGGCSGASLDLFDVTISASTPHKFLSTGSGNFQIKNSGCTANLLVLTDGGQLQIPVTTGTAPLSISSTTPVANLTVQNCSSCTVLSITNSTGIQLFSTSTTCSTSGVIDNACTTGAITLPVAYADTNYRLSCTGQGPTALPIVQTYTKSNTTFTITIVALTAAVSTFTSYDCMAQHN